jgi:hypothetical protein
MMTEREFWSFVGACLRVLWVGLPHTMRGLGQGVWLTGWTVWRLTASRYLGYRGKT